MSKKCQNKLNSKGMMWLTPKIKISNNFNMENVDGLKTVRVNRITYKLELNFHTKNKTMIDFVYLAWNKEFMIHKQKKSIRMLHVINTVRSFIDLGRFLCIAIVCSNYMFSTLAL